MPIIALLLAALLAGAAALAASALKPGKPAGDVSALIGDAAPAPRDIMAKLSERIAKPDRPARSETAAPRGGDREDDRALDDDPGRRPTEPGAPLDEEPEDVAALPREAVQGAGEASPTPKLAAKPAEAPPEPVELDRDRSSLEERVLRFVEAFHEQANREPSAAQAFLRTAYAPVVAYFGRRLSREQVLSDKRQFYSRWPRRDYRIRPETAAIACSDAERSCRVAVVIDFSAESPARRAVSRGVTTSALVLDVAGPNFRVLTEDEARLRRY